MDDKTKKLCERLSLCPNPDMQAAALIIKAKQKDIERLSRELEEARRDAERYRWLRDNACYRASDGDDGPVLVCRADDEDAAIDAAIKAQETSSG